MYILIKSLSAFFSKPRPQQKTFFVVLMLLVLANFSLRWQKWQDAQALLTSLRWHIRGFLPAYLVWSLSAIHYRWFKRYSCLPLALVAQSLLQSQGYLSQLHIGYQKEDSFKAHAWVSLNGLVIVGDREDLANYHEFEFTQGASRAAS